MNEEGCCDLCQFYRSTLSASINSVACLCFVLFYWATQTQVKSSVLIKSWTFITTEVSVRQVITKTWLKIQATEFNSIKDLLSADFPTNIVFLAVFLFFPYFWARLDLILYKYLKRCQKKSNQRTSIKIEYNYLFTKYLVITVYESNTTCMLKILQYTHPLITIGSKIF